MIPPGYTLNAGGNYPPPMYGNGQPNYVAPVNQTPNPVNNQPLYQQPMYNQQQQPVQPNNFPNGNQMMYSNNGVMMQPPQNTPQIAIPKNFSSQPGQNHQPMMIPNNFQNQPPPQNQMMPVGFNNQQPPMNSQFRQPNQMSPSSNYVNNQSMGMQPMQNYPNGQMMPLQSGNPPNYGIRQPPPQMIGNMGYDYPPPNYQSQAPPPNYGNQQVRPDYNDYKQYYLVNKDSNRNLRSNDNLMSSNRSERGRNNDNQTEYSDRTPPRDYYDQAGNNGSSRNVRLVKQNSSKQMVRKPSATKGIMSTLMRSKKKDKKSDKKTPKSPKQSKKRMGSFSELDLEEAIDEYDMPPPAIRGRNTRDVRSKLKEKPRHQEYRPREADMNAQANKGDVMKALVKQAWSVQWSDEYKKPYYFNKYTGESLWEPPEEIMS